MRKLLIISASSRMLREPVEPVKATERFDGLFMRITRSYVHKAKNVDVLILSPEFGLISPNEKIPYRDPLGGSWNKAQFPKDKIQTAKIANLEKMKRVLSNRKYDEIYVNAGKAMLQLVEGFEQIVPKTTKITYARGNGIGPKVAHMKNWFELQICVSHKQTSAS